MERKNLLEGEAKVHGEKQQVSLLIRGQIEGLTEERSGPSQYNHPQSAQ